MMNERLVLSTTKTNVPQNDLTQNLDFDGIGIEKTAMFKLFKKPLIISVLWEPFTI